MSTTVTTISCREMSSFPNVLSDLHSKLKKKISKLHRNTFENQNKTITEKMSHLLASMITKSELLQVTSKRPKSKNCSSQCKQEL